MPNISTAARRIAREVNATSAHVKLHFDGEGSVLASHEAELSYVAPQAWMSRQVAVIQGRKGSRFGRLTQQDAQDYLDAHAAHPDDPAARDCYVSAARLTRGA